MSIVSGVVLCTSCCELDFLDGDVGPLLQINEWLAAQDLGPLVRVEGLAGGNKHPQMFIACAGYNYFYSHEDAFAAFVMSLPWENPENVVLVIEPEEGATRLWRPSATEPAKGGEPPLTESLKCLTCGHAMTTALEDVPYSAVPGVTIHVPVSRCSNCGHYEVAIPAIDELNRVLRARSAESARPAIDHPPPVPVRDEFAVHLLNEQGLRAAETIAIAFTELLNALDAILPSSRERLLVITHLQEAAFWAKRGIAVHHENRQPGGLS